MQAPLLMLNKTNIYGVSSLPSDLGAPGLHTNPTYEVFFAPRPKKQLGDFFGKEELGPSAAHGALRNAEPRRSWKLLSQPRFHNAPRPRSGPRSQLRRCPDAPACLSFPPRIRLIWADPEFPRQDPSPPDAQRQGLAQTRLRAGLQPQGATLKLLL